VRSRCIRVSAPQQHAPRRPPRILDLILDLEQRHVLLIDDILDTGRTLSVVVAEIRKRKPASVRTCVLLDKKVRREVPLEADFVGFPIPDQFVVGYGLDFAERYRNLPSIGVLKPELQNPPEWA
jgi:hypoxanthine phosphoribosyltransferase